MTGWRNTDKRYGWIHAGFHWLIGLSVLSLLAIGLYMTGMDRGLAQMNMFGLHKSLGAVVLVLMTLRLSWRLYGPVPAPFAHYHSWEVILAKITHALLYTALFVMPLTGWLGSSAKGYTVSVFHLFSLPDLVGENEGLSRLCYKIHNIVAWGVIGLVILHVAGTLKHAVIDRDRTLARIIPFLRMALTFLFLVPATGHAATAWVIDKEKSSLTFEATQQGARFKGEFGQFGGKIEFDPADLANSYVRINIGVRSVGTHSSERDKYILDKPWLDANAFPESVYEASKFTAVTVTSYVVDGTLTLKGVSLPVQLKFTFTPDIDNKGNKVANVEGTALLQRLDFGIGSGEWRDTAAVGNPVTVRFSLVVSAANPQAR